TTAQADDKFMVIISTDFGATWTAANATVWNNTGDGNYVYNAISHTGDSITISLSQYAGQTIRIAFYGESTASGGDNDLHIANVVVDNAGSGPGPVVTDPTVATNAAENIAQTTATLKATITNPDGVTITAKGFQWKATNGGTYTSVTGTGTGNTFTANLTNLTPNTSYTYKAFITFNGTTVEGSEMTFTTLEQGVEPCDIPTGLNATDVQGESITITWDNNADVSSWNIQYRPEGGQLSTASTQTNSYTITGLTGGTTYQIQVQANCGDGNLSDWSSAITVTTTGIANWLENSVTLFPNPAKEYVDIRIDGDLNVTMMEVYDVYGKLVNTVNVIDNPTRINVSGLANGMYFVRVTTEAGAVTKTFVKK
ncbi:MAG: fibronectin type III domain-containing protein, partial [Bacteroidales bacterium]|nr:fibronectin type III domain-containing protein [Bacteroidales bacterium]